jgi:signal transduction histidine kinase
MTWSRPARADVALALAAVLPTWAALAGRLEPEARPADALAVAMTGLLGLPMLVGRRWPVPALLATVLVLATYYQLGYSAVGLVVPLAPALYNAAAAGRLRSAAVVGSSLFLASTGWRVFDPYNAEDVSEVLAYDFALSGLLLAAVLALGDAVRSRRGWQAELQLRLRLADEDREAEAARRVTEERLRIARDVHDVVGHTVAVVTLHAAVAAEALDDDPAAARRALTTIRSASRDALRDLRDTVGLLRDDDDRSGHVGAPVTGLADLPQLVATAAATGLDVRLVVTGGPAPVGSPVEGTVHRLVQEALTNVLRHAGARSAVVDVAYGAQHLTVTVSDDGCGSTGGDGHGLRGMQERVALVGGTFLARNRAEAGFEVSAVLPLRAEQAQVAT